MPPKPNLPIAPVLSKLGSAGLVAAPLVPTETGLKKAILDATRPIREMLSAAGLHDFAAQGQGQDQKVEIPAFFVGDDEVVSTGITAYRPTTKNGDPRIWIRGLPKYATPQDLICLIPMNDALFVINASRPHLIDAALAPGGVLANGQPVGAPGSSAVLALLAELRRIAAKGWLTWEKKAADNAVGLLVERELGIRPNSSQEPDYLGIEVKGRRLSPTGGTSGSLQTLFSKTPDWALGAHPGDLPLLDAHGYIADDGVFRLMCTVGPKANPRGLYTRVDDSRHAQLHVKSRSPAHVCLAWPLAKLEQKVATKHRVTAWVDADRRIGPDGMEQFWLRRVEFSASPSAHLLGALLADGAITLDLTLKKKGSGAKQHGYLFRMRRSTLPSLFPAPFAGHDLR